MQARAQNNMKFCKNHAEIWELVQVLIYILLSKVIQTKGEYISSLALTHFLHLLSNICYFQDFFFLFFFSSLQLPLTLVEYNRDCPPSSSLSLFTKLIAVQQHSYTPHALPFFLFWSPKSLIIWQNP